MLTHTYTRTHCTVCYFTTITTILSYLPLFPLFLTVRPDPPVSLNWTLLDISPSGLNYDVMVNWKPPPTADIKGGWMQIVYELQHRDRNTTNWEKVSLSSFLFSFFTSPPPRAVLHTLAHTVQYKHDVPFGGKTCCLVQWARCHVSSPSWGLRRNACSFSGKAVEARARPSGKTQPLWRKRREGSVGQRPRDLKQADIYCSPASQSVNRSLGDAFRSLHW